MATARRMSRRRWLAESNGSMLSDVTEYQPGLIGGRLPIYDDGGLYVVQLVGDSPKKLAATLEGREWDSKPSWLDKQVTIYRHKES